VPFVLACSASAAPRPEKDAQITIFFDMIISFENVFHYITEIAFAILAK
jgi:hypothetical protein